MPATPLSWRHATGADDFDAVRQLLVEYQRAIGVDLGFQNFIAELDSLPGAYAPPLGRLLVATSNGTPVGCVALRGLSASTCEMKRLFVRAGFEGQGVGRLLVSAAIDEARSIGYRVLQLDTLPTMERAQGLYRSLGFTLTAPYTFNPVPGAKYFELRL